MRNLWAVPLCIVCSSRGDTGLPSAFHVNALSSIFHKDEARLHLDTIDVWSSHAFAAENNLNDLR